MDKLTLTRQFGIDLGDMEKELECQNIDSYRNAYITDNRLKHVTK
jgi:hypothetical protein